MRQSIYSEIDKKIEESLNLLQVTDPFFYSEMETIYEIIKGMDYLSPAGLVKGPLPYVSKDEALLIAIEFLEKCNPKYKSKFIEDYEKDKVTISEEKRSIVSWNPNTLEYNVAIHDYDTVETAKDIIHEYFHALNINPYALRESLTETVSLTAEFMLLSFLKEKGYNDYDLNIINQRRRNYLDNNLHFLKMMLPLYIEKKQKGHITRETLEKIPSTASISKSNFEKNLEKDLYSKRDDIYIYKYVLGYIHAKALLARNLSFDSLSEINELLKEGNFVEFETKIIGDDTPSTLCNYCTKEDFSYKPRQIIKK